MYLYVFADAVTGETQQPILAHNDQEATRIARMAFANVPSQILPDLYLAKVISYDHTDDNKFILSPLYHGSEFVAESEANNDR